MRYPIDLKTPSGTGFAVANDDVEHMVLSDAGYTPAYVAPVIAEVVEDIAPAKRAYNKRVVSDDAVTE